MRRAVRVIGIGDDGCRGLTSRALDAVASAHWLVGGARQLAFFPAFDGERIVLEGGVHLALERIAAIAEEHNVCVLASGDPLFFGVGALLLQRLGSEHVEVIPQPSSLQWAFARAGLKWDDAQVISLHGRERAGFVMRLRQLHKVGCFTDATNTPAAIAASMLEHGEGAWNAWVCENLCGPGERVRRFTLEALSTCEDIGPLNVLLLVRDDPSWRAPAALPFLPESAFEKRMPKRGLITKREVRLLSLAQLQIRPDSVIWDIGAGSGSVSIEAAMLAPRGRVYAIEVDPEGVALCQENARAHGADNLRVIAGRAPEALADLEAPDAVFVGGSKGSMRAIIDTVLAKLRPEGRVVANAVTLENAHEIYAAMRAYGTPEVTLVQISRAEPLARYMRYEALNPIQIFALQKTQAEPRTQESEP